MFGDDLGFRMFDMPLLLLCSNLQLEFGKVSMILNDIRNQT